MRTQTQVEEMFRRLYRDLGNDPADLIQINPMDGGWENALSYEVTRKDMKKTRVWRRDLEDGSENGIKTALAGLA